MNFSYTILRSPLTFFLLVPTVSYSVNVAASHPPMEETTVIADRLFQDTNKLSPSSYISAKDLEGVNLMTIEDSVAYEPSIIIRRRFVGDPNGTIGIRGSGMFQTARSMVFADGLPLHYLLQTRWSGSPRWSLVGPDELESAEVIYGPFSAEYSGNAMGGVVNIKTRTPKERRVTIEGSLMSQKYDVLGTDDNFNGRKLFISYEDLIGDLGVYASYNHLKNNSHPMSNYDTTAAKSELTGYISGRDEDNNDVLYFGDSGEEQSISDLYKLKLTYDLESIQLRGTIAYEDREREENDRNSYLRDVSGNIVWDGQRVFEERAQIRESLLLGFGLSGELDRGWFYDVYATHFDIIKDKEVRTGLNPSDSAFGVVDGRITEHDNTGWQTLDLKVGTQALANNESMRLSIGYHIDQYELGLKSYNTDAATEQKTSDRSPSGGKTSTQALFAQWGLAIDSQWDVALGLRYEDWQASDGFTGNFQADDRSETAFSPKFSLAYQLNSAFNIRYSLAKAYRFPLTEELFSNESRTTSVIVSDPSLESEVGIHHSLSFDHTADGETVRVNLFYDVVEDTIYNQSGEIGGQDVSTFLAVDEVQTKGVEFIYNKYHVLNTPINLRFNLSYTDAEITKNEVNPSIEGNNMPRIPHWRSNLMLGYDLTRSVNVNTSFRYASNSYGDLDNGDKGREVYGAIDSYLFVNARSNWQVNDELRLSLGVDNIFDELAYVAHPWPSRTFFVEAKYTF